MREVQDKREGAAQQGEVSTFKELQGLFEVVSKGKKVWETTFDAILDPVLIVSKDYRVERANLAAAHSAGLDVREVIGKTCFEIFAKRTTPCVGCPMKISQETGTPHRKRLKPYVDNREFLASAFPIHSKEGPDPEITVMQYQDRSQIRKLEEQLMQNEKMAALGLFASGIAHDINNPLTGVLAFVQLAMQGVDKSAQLYEDLQEVEKSALRCKKIIEDLLAISRPIEKTEKKPIDLGDLIKKILPNIEIQFKDLNYHLDLTIPKLPKVEVCESKIEQVFANLLANAFQSLSENGAIEIGGGTEEEYVFVNINDTGKGISEENLISIFDPYFTTRRDRGGTGLGLTVSYNIVREHGGEIEVVSELGKGTSFRVLIPMGGK